MICWHFIVIPLTFVIQKSSWEVAFFTHFRATFHDVFWLAVHLLQLSRRHHEKWHPLLVLLVIACSYSNSVPPTAGHSEQLGNYEVRSPLNEDLTAIDCSHPQHLHKFSLSHQDCARTEEEEKEPEQIEMAILEQRKYFDVRGKSCAGRVSNFQCQCRNGSFVAEQRWAGTPDKSVQYEITAEQCREMHQTRTFMNHELMVNAENVIKFTSQGVIYTENWNKFCQGEAILNPNTTSYPRTPRKTKSDNDSTEKINTVEDKIVEMDIVRITLVDDIAIRFDEDKTKSEDLDAGREISCNANENGCDLGTVTYIWDNPVETCNMDLLRKITGHWNNTNFISENEGIIINGENAVRPNGCNFKATPTKFKNIFIVPADQLPSVTRHHLPFQVEDKNLPNFVDEKDQFEKWKAEKKMLKHRNEQKKKVCDRLTSNQEKENVIRQETGIIFPTDTLGIFTRAKGEAIEEFQCSITTVKPREMAHCTADLPVTYQDTEYYLAPFTRILTKATSMQPCSRLGAAEFLTQSGRWITAVPEISYTSLPKEKTETESEHTASAYTHGGIYSEDELRQYSNQILFPRQQKEVTSTLSAQRCMNGKRSCGFYKDKHSTKLIMYDTEFFHPISLIEGLPGELGHEMWSAVRPKIVDFVIITWLIYLSWKVICGAIFVGQKLKKHKTNNLNM